MNKKQEVINFIFSKIQEGKYKKGTRIISEPMLAHYLNTSRSTVRLALQELSLKGIIEKKQGSGSYITDYYNKIYKKKYILIYNNMYNTLNPFLDNINQLSIYLQNIISDLGYEPYEINADNSFNNIKNINEIAGVISLSNTNLKIYEENKIPVVVFSQDFDSSYPYVKTDIFNFYIKINNLLKNHNLNNVHIFNYEDKLFSESVQLVLAYFKKIYHYNEIPQATSEATIIDFIEHHIKRIKKAPDAIVFLHNSLYTDTQALQKNKLFKNTKIITHWDKSKPLSHNIKICRLELNLKECADKTMELLNKLIDGEQPIKICYNIPYEIINEDIFE